MKGNGKSRSGGKPAAKTKTPPAPRKTAEELSDQQRQELLLHHRRKLMPLLDAEANAKGAVTKAYELAKKEGVTKRALKLSVAIKKGETDKLKTEQQEFMDVVRWTGSDLGEQLELFGKQNNQERAFEDGRLAALDNEKAKPPAHLSQQSAKHWLEGWHDGDKQLSMKRAGELGQGGGLKPIGEAAAAAVDSLAGDDDQRKAA